MVDESVSATSARRTTAAVRGREPTRSRRLAGSLGMTAWPSRGVGQRDFGRHVMACGGAIDVTMSSRGHIGGESFEYVFTRSRTSLGCSH